MKKKEKLALRARKLFTMPTSETKERTGLAHSNSRCDPYQPQGQKAEVAQMTPINGPTPLVMSMNEIKSQGCHQEQLKPKKKEARQSRKVATWKYPRIPVDRDPLTQSLS